MKLVEVDAVAKFSVVTEQYILMWVYNNLPWSSTVRKWSNGLVEVYNTDDDTWKEGDLTWVHKDVDITEIKRFELKG